MILLSACAATPSGKTADYASTADVASTGVALSTVPGATELNPLALPMVPIRYRLSRHLEGKPCTERRSGHAWMSGVGYGATGNNLLILGHVGFAPLGLLAGIPAYHSVKRQPCIPVLSDGDILLLAKWRHAYEAGDVEALRDITASDTLVADYTALFERTRAREVVYSELESVRGGFYASYDVTFTYLDGEVKESQGRLRFEVAEGRIVAVD